MCGSVLVAVDRAGLGGSPPILPAGPLRRLEGRLYVQVRLSPNISCHWAGLRVPSLD